MNDTMKEITPKKYKHLLWKDELGADFLLLKVGEVYRFSPKTVRCHFTGFSNRSWLRKKGVILNETPVDEKFYILDVLVENLPKLIAKYGFRRRPHKNGKWLRNMENVLAHIILLYNPELKESK